LERLASLSIGNSKVEADVLWNDGSESRLSELMENVDGTVCLLSGDDTSRFDGISIR
jgi:hypothetical protein